MDKQTVNNFNELNSYYVSWTLTKVRVKLELNLQRNKHDPAKRQVFILLDSSRHKIAAFFREGMENYVQVRLEAGRLYKIANFKYKPLRGSEVPLYVPRYEGAYGYSLSRYPNKIVFDKDTQFTKLPEDDVFPKYTLFPSYKLLFEETVRKRLVDVFGKVYYGTKLDHYHYCDPYGYQVPYVRGYLSDWAGNRIALTIKGKAMQ